MNHPIKQLCTLVSVTAMIAAGCSSDSGPSSRAEAIVAAAQGGVAAADGADDCTTETIIDEYGFEIEITDCGEAGSSATDAAALLSIDALAELAPNEQVAATIQQTVVALGAAAAECGDAARWSQQVLVAADQIDRLSTSLVGAQSWIGSDDAKAAVEAVRNYLLFQPACGQRAEAATGTELVVVLEAAGDATTAYERLRIAALDPPRIDTSSDLWYHSDQFGHVQNVARSIENEALFETMLIGAGPTKRGLDPEAMTAATGSNTINVALAGLLPSLLDEWLQQLRSDGLVPNRVIIASASFEFFSGCGDSPNLLSLRESARLRQRAFANVPALADTAPSFRLTGGSGPNSGPIAEQNASTYPNNTAGRTIDVVGVRPGARTVQLESFGRTFADPKVCDDGFDQLAETILMARDLGASVYVVAMPLSEPMAELHPDGRSGHAEVLARQEIVATDNGSTFINFHDLLEADQFYDLNHPTPGGRVILTDALIEALS